MADMLFNVILLLMLYYNNILQQYHYDISMLFINM